MKAVIYEKYGPPEVLHPSEVPDPAPGPADVLIQIHACAITKGDCELRSPVILNTVWFIVRIFFGLFKPKNKILGSYIAGKVIQVGENVSRFRVGDRVFGMTGMQFGGYAEQISLPEKSVLALMPRALTYSKAAPAGLALDSIHFIDKLHLHTQDRLLINGAGGGIGTYALQLAKESHIHVTAVDSVDKHDILLQLGADAVIDYKKNSLQQHKEQYTAIFDVVGSLGFALSKRLLVEGGKYVSAIPEFDRIFLGLINNLFSSKKIMTGLTSPTPEDMQKLANLMEKGTLKSVIQRQFHLDQLVEAHRFIEKGEKIGNAILSLPINDSTN